MTDLQQKLEGRPYPSLDVLKNSITISQHLERNTLSTPNAEGRGEAQAQEPGSELHSISLLSWHSSL